MKTIYKLIKLNRILRSYRVKFFLVYIADIIGVRHLFLRLDPVNACNLSCSMCYYSDDKYAKKIRGRFTTDELNRVSDLFFRKSVQLVIGCGSEPTLHKGYIDIIKQASNAGIPNIGLTTNGQLVSEHDLEKMIEYGLHELTISIHGVKKTTYESLMVKAEYDRLIKLLTSLDHLKNSYNVSYPELRINYTINRDNLAELNEFFSVFGHFNIKTLQLRPMVDVGHTAYSYSELNENELNSYNTIIHAIRQECRSRSIICLSTLKDPNFTTYDKGTSYILPAILRTIHPNKVWMNDFDWRHESYREYCKRSNWRSTLLQTVVGHKEFFKKTNYYLTYDVD